MAKGKIKSSGKKAETRGDVRIGEPIKREVRVKINVAECAVKEAKVVKLENKVRKIQIEMAPMKQEITKLNKEIDKLCADVDSSTEERTILIREEFHYKKAVVRVVRADNGELLDERTMDKTETQFDLTQTPKGGVVAGKAGAKLRLANPVLTPTEAVKAARAPRKASNPAFDEVVAASDAQDPLPPGAAIAAARAHADAYHEDADPEAND
jgi:hypothetical protein